MIGRELDRDRIAVVDGFLDAATCARIQFELDFAWWRPSTVVNRDGLGGLATFESRTRRSISAGQRFFTDELLAEVAAIEPGVCTMLGVVADRLEDWQAIRYGPDDRFDTHHDAGLFGHEPAGERASTVLLYLQAPLAGGATSFPELGREVAAVAGRLVVWRNLTGGKPDPRMRHAAAPVTSGTKSVLTTWARERPIRI